MDGIRLGLIYLSIMVVLGQSEVLTTYDNFNKGDRVFGQEEFLKDYAILSNDPKGNLSHAFTICTSFFIEFATGDKNFLQLHRKDGDHWLAYQIGIIKKLKDFTEQVTLVYAGKRHIYFSSGLPIRTHTW